MHVHIYKYTTCTCTLVLITINGLTNILHVHVYLNDIMCVYGLTNTLCLNDINVCMCALTHY